METKHTENKLLYIKEHLSCQSSMNIIKAGVKYIKFDKSLKFERDDVDKNYLLFFLEGNFIISYDQFHNRYFHAGDMKLILHSSCLKGSAELSLNQLLMFIKFKNFILRSYSKVSSIEQLISLFNWGRSCFFAKFHDVFGVYAKQWMLKQRNKQLLERMSKPEVYIKNAFEELGFDS